MMRKLVTLTQASEHIRRDTDADDNDLELKLIAASEAVINYLKKIGATFLDSNGDLPVDSNDDAIGVPYPVKAATLLMIGYLYKNRDEDAQKAFAQGYLPAPVTALLYPLRDPALA